MVLSVEQAKGDAPLPDFLVAEDSEDRPQRAATSDALWEAYAYQAREVALRRGSQFLQAWIGLDVALRNGLARARAKAFGFEPSDYVVAEELESREVDTSAVVAEWRQASDPLAALRTLLCLRRRAAPLSTRGMSDKLLSKRSVGSRPMIRRDVPVLTGRHRCRSGRPKGLPPGP